MRKTTIGLLSCCLLLSGCASYLFGSGGGSRHGTSSSLVDFLYPDGQQPPDIDNRRPDLALPLRVGIAFVPGNGHYNLSEREQTLLLTRVADAFRERPFVSAIEVIPESYLRSARGVHGMQQVAAMFDVDVMALVSHDQLTLSAERDSAILYWTVVGALVVKGNVNDVQTMIDTAVFDVDSARLLFRAPGTHRQSANTTLMDQARDVRALQQDSFVQATDDMIFNLDQSLAGFREQVKAGERADVSWKPGYGGGAGAGTLLLLLIAAGRRRATRPAQ